MKLRCPYHTTCEREGKVRVRFSPFKFVQRADGTWKTMRNYAKNIVRATVCREHLSIYLDSGFKKVKPRKKTK